MHLKGSRDNVEVPRAPGLGLTRDIPPDAGRLGRAWPEVEPRLRCFLGSLGATRHQVDDLVQETAARALERQIPFDTPADLRRWCFVVAKRLWIDEIRSSRRLAALDEACETPGAMSEGPLHRVEDRAVLR